MWAKFTERSRRAVFFAQEEAGIYKRNIVDTEHLLLGILRESENVACAMLNKLGVAPAAVRVEILQQIAQQKTAKGEGNVQLGPLAKKAVDFSYEEAVRLNNNYIGTEHLLLGLIREETGIAGKVLAKLGVRIDAARSALIIMQDSAEWQRRDSEFTPTPKESTIQERIGPSDLGTIEPLNGRTVTEMVPSTAAFLQMLDVFEAQDADGYRELFASPTEAPVVLDADTVVKVLVQPRDASEDTLQKGLYVRVREGKHAGRAGWIRRGAFKLSGPDPEPFPPVLSTEEG